MDQIGSLLFIYVSSYIHGNLTYLCRQIPYKRVFQFSRYIAEAIIRAITYGWCDSHCEVSFMIQFSITVRGRRLEILMGSRASNLQSTPCAGSHCWLPLRLSQCESRDENRSVFLPSLSPTVNADCGRCLPQGCFVGWMHFRNHIHNQSVAPPI